MQTTGASTGRTAEHFEPTERVALGKTSATVSRLGFGGTPFGNLFRATDEGQLRAAVDLAWDAGLRYFDTAPQYGGGLAEIRLGKALRGRPRDDYAVSSKIGKLLVPTADGKAPAGIFEHGLAMDLAFDYTADGVKRSIEASLTRTGLDRLDVVLIHDVNRKYHGEARWEKYAEARDGACKALERLRAEGVIKAYGPALNDVDVNLKFLAEADIDCIMLPGRYTLLDRSAEPDLLAGCATRGVSVLIAGAFDSGILVTGAKPGATYDYRPAAPEIMARVALLEQACAHHGVPLAAAALQFPLRHPAVASVVTGMSSPAEVDANLSFMRTPVPEGLWRELA